MCTSGRGNLTRFVPSLLLSALRPQEGDEEARPPSCARFRAPGLFSNVSTCSLLNVNVYVHSTRMVPHCTSGVWLFMECKYFVFCGLLCIRGGVLLRTCRLVDRAASQATLCAWCMGTHVCTCGKSNPLPLHVYA